MKLLNAKQAAEHLNVSVVTFWRMRKDYPLPSVRAYKRELFDEEVLDEWFLNPERISACRG